MIGAPAREAVEADRDVDPGFPWKRLVGRIVLGNMVFFGAWFQMRMLGESLDFMDHVLGSPGFYGSRGSRFAYGASEYLGAAGEFLEDVWWYSSLELLAPGVIGGIVWYLVGRWHESVVMRKRREQLADLTIARQSGG